MTRHASFRKCLGGSPAGLRISRLCTLTFAAILLTGGAVAGFGQVQPQAQPDAAKPATPVAEKKPAAEPEAKTVGSYMVHQSIEVGGRYTTVTGSQPMWDTLFNQSSGGRVLGQSLEMHSINTSKTPFFDSLSSYSTGYGGDPIDVTRLRFNKGRIYDFAGTFRRDRNYFDYNLLDTSLLTTYTAADPVLVSEADSLHLFNTVRRNSDGNLTLLPLSFISFRIGMNHGTHEGPAYSSIHNAGDTQTLEWFRNASDTYSGGVDVKVAKRTTLSYDQFYVLYKGDTTFQMAPTPYTLSNGTPVSLGFDVLGGATTCGSASTVPSLGKTLPLEVSNGIVNQYCSATITETGTQPIRTHFPTEQLRFSSHYWDKVSFNGRYLYSGAASTINNFNQSFNGLNTRTENRQEIETGAGPGGQFANNKRINSSADFGVVAELNKYFALSDAFNYSDLRTSGFSMNTMEVWTGTAGSTKTTPPTPTTSLFTPLTDPTITQTTTTSTVRGLLDQKIGQNTVLATATIIPQVKVSGGWRFKNREINDPHATNLTWHENGAVFGTVIQPSRALRLNINLDTMDSKYASGTAVLGEPATPLTLASSNTFTRIAPNKSYHLRARATIMPAKWINFAVSGNDYSAKNDDPQVNHFEHNHDVSFATTIMPMEGLSFDFNYAHDDVFAETDLCYIFASNPNAPIPAGANGSSGTCLQSATNPEGTLPLPSPPGTALASQLYLGNGRYDAPANFFAGSVNYSPSKYFRINSGLRLNDVNGQAEQLNPLMVPGALQSKMVTPFADMQINIASQWAWHGNWQHDGYKEGGPLGTLPSRNTNGDVITLGVKYAF